MVFILSLFLIFLGLIKKDSKILFYIIWLLLILLLGGNIENADRLAYIINYDDIANEIIDISYEYGFQILCKIGSFLGMSYDQFLFFVALIGLTLIASTIKLYTSNISYVLVLYFIYPFIWDTVQIRNFLAMSIIIYGSRYIISYKKEYMKYIISVLIASSMHISAMFYLCGLVVFVKNTKKIFTAITVLTVASIFLMPIIIPYITILTSAHKVSAYTITQTSLLTKSAVIIYCSFSTILVIIARNILTKVHIEENSSLKRKFIQIDPEAVLKINIICMLFLYFLIDNLDFFRLHRNIYIINYILFAICLSKIKKISRYYMFFLTVLMFVMISFFFLIVYVSETNIVDPVFNNNMFFN